MKKKALIFNHAGSKNHGCEALVRTIVNIIKNKYEITLLSDSPEEDYYYGLNKENIRIVNAKTEYSKKSLSFGRAYLLLKTTGNYTPMDVLPYKSAVKSLEDDYDIALSIGGDVYCYTNYPLYIEIHKLIKEKAKKTILVGCSLEADLFNDKQFIKDMNSFDLITARESLTYNLLQENGITHSALIPDSAFQLKKEEVYVSSIVRGSVGINISPLVCKKRGGNVILDNYLYLIEKILSETDRTVSLIPHVIWNDNDDRTVLKKIYDEFSDSDRIELIDDKNCMQLKHVISCCDYFIGARTHATIAAYSSEIPTLVVGYSIKSKGIAKDLFGDYENYVMSAESINSKDELWNSFSYIYRNSDETKNILHEKMCTYIKEVDLLKELL